MDLSQLRAGPVVPVSDLDASRSFYEDVLGLRGEPAPGGYVLHCGDGTVIYLLAGTDYAGQAEWPLVSFRTDQLSEVVADLRRRGVTLEAFADGPFKTDEHGMASVDGMKIAWLRDPDRQVISLFELTAT